MRSKRFIRILGVGIGVLALTAAAQADIPSLKNASTGNPQLKSIEAISFGPQGLLLIGDGRGNQVVGIETGDTTPQKWSRTEIKDIDNELAGRVGTTAKGIQIMKMAVNPASQKAYFAIRIMSGKQDLILTVDGAGKIAEFALDNVKHVRVPLPTDTKINKITDIAWAGDRVLVSAQANETFGSKIFSISAPVAADGSCSCFSTETYHVAHGKWETRAPMYSILPYEEDGKKYVVGSFTCTPIVKYGLDDLKPGATVKGASIIEVGYGNQPRDMFIYEKDGKKHILMSTVRMARFHKSTPVGPSPYWVVKVDYDLLRETARVNEKALVRVNQEYENITDRAQVVPAYHGVMHMDALDGERAVVVRENKGGLSLVVMDLP